MGYTIPEGVDTMLDIVGVGWPNVDEDAYRDMADALREFADDADDDAHAAHAHIQRLLSSGRSESLTALDKHWGKVQSKNKDMAKAARVIAGALDRVADLIVARKILAVGELADLAATVGITLAFAPVTAGLSTLLAGAKIAATRIAFKKVLKEMAEAAVAEIVATLTEPAVAALENIVADLAIQATFNVLGVQDGYDAGQTVQAGKEGLRINSAGGPGGGGPGGGPVIDHDAHTTAGGKLGDVQIAMAGKTAGKIGKAKSAHGRAKGKDSLTAVLDSTIDGVVEKLTKGHKDLGEHVGSTLPKSMKAGSKTHRDTDQDVRDRVDRITKGEQTDGKEGTGRKRVFTGTGWPGGWTVGTGTGWPNSMDRRPGPSGPANSGNSGNSGGWGGDGGWGGGSGGSGGGGNGNGGGGGTPSGNGNPIHPPPAWHGRSADQMRHHRRDALDVSGLDEAQRMRLLESEAGALANDAQKASGNQPKGKDGIAAGCSGALVHGDVLTSHTSSQSRHGQAYPHTHPALQSAYDDVEQRAKRGELVLGRGHGRCAEVSLVSDRLHELGRTESIASLDDARRALSGSKIYTVAIGEQFDNDGNKVKHGEYLPPCRSCGPVLEALGVGLHS
ncbi:YwqJ-related putative deaminase [Streptomyces sp. NPDC000410]|uniref:YwqJ-related putative deaminase n=1 Tax=Streptomyces sp. NPDC000410 TaxID=3154254 RepID=UPI0033318CFD